MFKYLITLIIPQWRFIQPPSIDYKMYTTVDTTSKIKFPLVWDHPLRLKRPQLLVRQPERDKLIPDPRTKKDD